MRLGKPFLCRNNEDSAPRLPSLSPCNISLENLLSTGEHLPLPKADFREAEDLSDLRINGA